MRSREYSKRGRSDRYEALAKEFDTKYKAEAQTYLLKNVGTLMDSNPGKAYSTLKRMGAKPGDCTDSNTFSLTNSHHNSQLMHC